MTLDDVRRALALPRPGRAAQIRMSPRPRPGDVFPLPPEIHPKEAGVLLLLYPTPRGLSFFLTRRTETVEAHKGQIALPGGARESGESLRETALREACEELGLQPACAQILGEPLTPVYIPVSNYRVTPFVAYTPARPPTRAAPAEVVEIIETPLDIIMDEQNIFEEQVNIRGYVGIVPYFRVNEHKVWGATAMMLSEFAEMLRQSAPEEHR